jgi:hypothetical protein
MVIKSKKVGELKEYQENEGHGVRFGPKDDPNYHLMYSHCEKLMKQGQNLMKARMAQSWKHHGSSKQQHGLGKNSQIFQPQQPNVNASLGKSRKRGEKKNSMINNAKQSRSVERFHETKIRT